jgi:hypothetical protein
MGGMTMLTMPKNIELYYYADHIEYVKDGDPNKPLTPAEKNRCDEVVRAIIGLKQIKQ